MVSDKKFIVVDDDPTNNMICKFILNRLFPEAPVALYTEPEEALKELQALELEALKIPKILFLDLNMPLMTGWEFLEKFRTFDSAITKNFTIYILSSSIDQRDREKAVENELVSGFISKPLTAELLNGLRL